MLSRTESGKISGGCSTIAIWLRSDFSVYSPHIDAVDRRRRPPIGSKKRGKRPSSVDLPAPVGPTTAILAPAGTSRSMPVKHRRVGAIAKADAAPGDVAARAPRREAAAAVLEIGLGVEDFKDPARADAGAGDQSPALRDLVDRRVELREVGDEHDQLADRQICPT